MAISRYETNFVRQIMRRGSKNYKLLGYGAEKQQVMAFRDTTRNNGGT
jgi:hypothetical protein